MLKKLILISTLLWAGLTGAIYASPVFTHIYFFGDSLTDIGNLKVTDPFKPGDNIQNAPVTNWNDSQTPATPGKTWAEYFANYYGLHAVPSKAGGDDYAIAGATSRQMDTIEVATFQGSSDWQHSLYVIWIGANDLQAKQLPTVVAANIGDTIDKLYNSKVQARYFLIISIPDITQTPLYQNCNLFKPTQGNPYCTPEMIQNTKALLDSYNLALQQLTASIQSVYPGIKIYYYDIHYLFDDLVHNPSGHGFNTPTIPDANLVCTQIPCPNQQLEWYHAHNLGQYGDPSLYKNPDDFIFYNTIHPTTHAHQILANAIYTWLQSQP